MKHEQIRNAVFAFGTPVGETEVYSSLGAAALALEPWQLDDTLAVDGRAHRVLLTHDGHKVSAQATGEDVDTVALRRRVEDDLRNFGALPASDDDVFDLLQQLVDVAGYAD